MTRENVTTVQLAIAALNDRDVDAYLACCVEDVESHTPVSPLKAHTAGRQASGGSSPTSPRRPGFRIETERIEALGLRPGPASMRISATARESGVDMAAETANVYDLIDGKIKTIAIYLNRDEAAGRLGWLTSPSQSCATPWTRERAVIGRGLLSCQATRKPPFT